MTARRAPAHTSAVLPAILWGKADLALPSLKHGSSRHPPRCGRFEARIFGTEPVLLRGLC